MSKKSAPAALAAKQIAVRFPGELLTRLERHLEKLRVRHPGLHVTRADAVRMLVHERLVALEDQAPTTT